MKVLIVEDDAMTLDHVASSLRDAEFSVYTAYSVAEADRHIRNTKIDAAVLDIRLGDTESGFDVAKILATHQKKTSIMFFSAFSEYENDARLQYSIPFFSKADPNAIENITKLISDIEVSSLDNSQVESRNCVLFGEFDIELYKKLAETPHLLKELNWERFEQLIARLLEDLGYEVDLTQPTKDGGIDIFALSRTGDFGKELYLIQAKKSKNRIGVEPVRQLMFLHGHHKASKSCLATTSTFTRGAWNIAATYEWQLELRDYLGIQNWIKAVLGASNAITRKQTQQQDSA